MAWNPISAAGTAARYYGNAVNKVSNNLPGIGGAVDYLAGGSIARDLGQERGISEAVGYGLTGNYNTNDGSTTSTNTQPTGNNTNPNNTTTNNGSTYGGGGSNIDWSSVQDAQSLLDQANFQMGRLDPQRMNALGNLDNTYSKYKSDLQQQYDRNKGNYDTQRTQSIQDNERAKANIDSKVRSRASALQRLLGSAGAGDSQAAYELAPYAAARTGTQLRNEVNNTYGRNLSNLDLSWNQYGTDYNQSVNDLATQQENQRRQIEQDYLNNKVSAMDNMRKAQSALDYAKGGNATSAQAIRNATLPQIYQLLAQIDALGSQAFNPTVKDASYVAPDVAQYTTSNVNPVGGVDQAQASNVDPMYSWLLKKQQEDFNTFGY